MGLPFYCDCVGWDRADLDALTTMQDDAIDVTRRTFLKHVDREQVRDMERALGYERGGLVMANDYHVSYHRSKLHGKRVYYFKHSGIEHVFHNPGHKAQAPRPYLARQA